MSAGVHHATQNNTNDDENDDDNNNDDNNNDNDNNHDRVLSLYNTDEISSLAGVLDTVCLVAFCIELCLRAGVYSWWIGPDAALRNPWILLDVYLVISHGCFTAASVSGGRRTENYHLQRRGRFCQCFSARQRRLKRLRVRRMAG